MDQATIALNASDGAPASAKAAQEPPAQQDTVAGQRPDWLPEKFKDVEALAAAYKELEKHLGSGDAAKAAIGGEKGEEAQKAADATLERGGFKVVPEDAQVSYGAAFDGAIEKAGLKPVDLHNQFVRSGDLSPEQYKALGKGGLPEPVVRAYIKGLLNDADGGKGADAAVEAFADAIVKEYGGAEGYAALTAWASTNLSKDEIEAFNRVVSGGDESLARLAVEGLAARRARTTGMDRLSFGSGAKSGVVGFKTMAEQQKAFMEARKSGDPRAWAEYERRALAGKI